MISSRITSVVGLVGAACATAAPAAKIAGIASLGHASGGAILSSVGVGGTGYIAGTLGSGAAITLGLLGTPIVIGLGSVAAAGAIAATVYKVATDR